MENADVTVIHSTNSIKSTVPPWIGNGFLRLLKRKLKRVVAAINCANGKDAANPNASLCGFIIEIHAHASAPTAGRMMIIGINPATISVIRISRTAQPRLTSTAPAPWPASRGRPAA